MTLQAPESITCPACGREQTFPMYRSVNVTRDPALKAELLDGELTRFSCAACGHAAQVSYPLLYHDMEQMLMVWVVPGEGPGPEPLTSDLQGMGDEAQALGRGYRCRLVRTRNDLVEKVRLF